MPSFWSNLDDYLQAKVEALDGVDPLFSGVTVVAGEQFDPDQAESPFVLVRGTDADDSDTEGRLHGGVMQLDNIQYPYELIYLSDNPVLVTARAIAKDAVTVLRDMLMQAYCFGDMPPGDDGESFAHVRLGRREVFVRGVGGQNREHKYVAEGVASFTVSSKT